MMLCAAQTSKQILSTEFFKEVCGGQSGDFVFAFCCLRVIKIIWDIELVH